MKTYMLVGAVLAASLAQVAEAGIWQEFSGAGCSGAPFFNGGTCGGPQQCVTVSGASVSIASSFGVPCSVPFFNDTTCGTSGGAEVGAVGGGCATFSDFPAGPAGVGSFRFGCSV
ncbi:hypothetical protein PUNSTDRAFT_52139 [Punctularia strigosozonata HHB-11173 SS5]|uniref:uncharacterized protein n=1 Tax=Punctularia strigosozonata (strain HHB-11173) TaxID=741275 RepID=UPI0004416B94|nr:uncharacterized protein PUNSTDRAFT_52139 [Punctularia strigosozonata HHB-11173 SS5]EIN10046.1 hypothetical protein PUNSTDRAFT_52139 [Punctularia strigosozonata HHB-11173 SS5]